MRGTILWIVAIASLAAGGPSPAGGGKETGEDVLKKIQGTWRFVAKEVDGKPRPAEQVAKLTITFTGDKWSVREDGKVVQAGTHKFDPSKKPAQVDAAVTAGEGKGSTMLGIYELQGDMMKVCFDPQGKERPTSLTAKTGQFAAVVRREKPKP
ncbi:MAG TPA: TIGR03067 domain-containing protein [Gemmataceae bacterium]|nr:TIGR03067 domain-containing protein [Gemmataceae bacterium]